MLAVPHRAELRSRALGAAARSLAAIAFAVGLVAVAGRVEDLNLSLFEAIALPAAVLIAAVLYWPGEASESANRPSSSVNHSASSSPHAA